MNTCKYKNKIYFFYIVFAFSDHMGLKLWEINYYVSVGIDHFDNVCPKDFITFPNSSVVIVSLPSIY